MGGRSVGGPRQPVSGPRVASQGDGSSNPGPTGPAAAKPLPEDNTTYHPENAVTATKTNTPIMNTPASIQVVPRAVLQDQAATNLSEAINNVSGVIAADGNQSLGQWIRGFLTYSYYRDGVRMDQNITNTTLNPADADRIEVLKGPASILYGSGDPGGLVNMVTKRPLDKPYTSVQQMFGSWSYYRTTVDTTGPLNEDKSILYRFNGAWDNSHYFPNNSYSRDYYLAPKVLWNIDEHTSFTTYATFRKNVNQDVSLELPFTLPGPNSSNPLWTATYGTGGAPLSFLPRTQNMTQPWGRANGEEANIGYLFSRDLNQDWNVKHRFNAQLSSFYHLQLFPSAYTNNTPYETYTFPELLPTSSAQSYYTSTVITGNINTFGAKHTLLIGTDYQHLNNQGYVYTSAIGGSPNNNPLYPIYTQFPSFLYDPTSRTDYGVHMSWWGAYIQDHIELPHNIFIMAGARYDHISELNPALNPLDLTQSAVTTNTGRVTPRFGLLWRPIPELSLYGTYLTNFGTLPIASTAPLPPELAQQWEVGAKSLLLDKRLSVTVAYYDLTKQNIATPDPTDQSGLRYFATGAARNRGFELDVSGELAPGLRVIGSYSYIASIITKDAHCDLNAWANYAATYSGAPPGGCVYDAYNTFYLGNPTLIGLVGNEGKRLGGVPRNAGSLWMTYEFQDDTFRGLKIGGGAIARSLTQGDNWNDFHLPGYATMQMMVGYTTKLFDRKTTFQLNANNLLDTRYYGVSNDNSPYSVYTGAPRSFKGTMRVEF